MEYLYIYRWDRQGRKGKRCRVFARGTMNSCGVEFEDGYQMCTSRNALRRFGVPPVSQQPVDVSLPLETEGLTNR